MMYYCVPLLARSLCGCIELTFSLKVFGYQCCYMNITHGSLNKSYKHKQKMFRQGEKKSMETG